MGSDPQSYLQNMDDTGHASCRAENARLRAQAEVLATALEENLYADPWTTDEQEIHYGFCYACDANKAENRHAPDCPWVLGEAALRAYRDLWVVMRNMEDEAAG
ncbi:MAG: hypothetical protein NUW01_10330 [Gemmatimonadaceae bacterium]|nr:hypothetical protein [Gemmatimonadaceae bacterium]